MACSEAFLGGLQADAVASAERMDSAVRHPLIEKLELTSTKPTNAVDFFIQMLHPDPAIRMTMAQAARHPFMVPAMQKLLSRGAKLEAADQAGSTPALSPSSLSSACHASPSHSVSMPPSSGPLPCESISASSLSSLRFVSTAHRLYLISQQLGLPLGLSLISNILSGILRHCCGVSKTKRASATVSKLTGCKTSQLGTRCADPRPACTQRLQAGCPQQCAVCNGWEVLSGDSELGTAADSPLARSTSSSSSSSSGSSTISSSCATTDSKTGSTEANSSCNAPDIG